MNNISCNPSKMIFCPNCYDKLQYIEKYWRDESINWKCNNCKELYTNEYLKIMKAL